jgi:hypothetical protein
MGEVAKAFPLGTESQRCPVILRPTTAIAWRSCGGRTLRFARLLGLCKQQGGGFGVGDS